MVNTGRSAGNCERLKIYSIKLDQSEMKVVNYKKKLKLELKCDLKTIKLEDNLEANPLSYFCKSTNKEFMISDLILSEIIVALIISMVCLCY